MNIYPAYIFKIQFQKKNQKSYETPSIIYTGLESLRKNNSTIALHVLYLKKKWIYIQPTFSKQNTNLNRIKKYVKNADFCSVEMPSEEDTKVLEFN